MSDTYTYVISLKLCQFFEYYLSAQLINDELTMYKHVVDNLHLLYWNSDKIEILSLQSQYCYW